VGLTFAEVGGGDCVLGGCDGEVGGKEKGCFFSFFWHCNLSLGVSEI
jgi:hypothetical protein